MRSVYILYLLALCAFYSTYGQERNNAFALQGVKWQTETISVSWENPTPEDEEERKWVQEAIQNSWQQHSHLRFTGWGISKESSKGIRIRIEDTPDGPHTKGLGTQLDGKPAGMTLNFTFRNWSPKMRLKRKEYIMAIAVHEFGHALGLAHEHNRTDCSFCDKEKQGTDGDYYVTTCDPNSVMNYCNPNYSNWGQLSDGDKKAIGILYTKTSNQSATVADNSIDVVHTSRELSNTEKKVWPDVVKFLKVYIQATPEERNLIKEVTYHLHPSFPNPVITISDPSYGFGLGLFVWGQSEITAIIKFKDGKEKVVRHFLDFDLANSDLSAGVKSSYTPDLNQGDGIRNETESGQVKVGLLGNTPFQNQKNETTPDDNFFFTHQFGVAEGNQGQVPVTVTIQCDEQLLERIEKVVYELPSTFNPAKRTVTDRASRFSLQFACGSTTKLSITVFFNDKTQKQASYTIDY